MNATFKPLPSELIADEAHQQLVNKALTKANKQTNKLIKQSASRKHGLILKKSHVFIASIHLLSVLHSDSSHIN